MTRLFSIAFLLLGLIGQAQYTQQLKGSIVDNVLLTPLPGASIHLLPSNQSTIADDNGFFRFVDLGVMDKIVGLL